MNKYLSNHIIIYGVPTISGVCWSTPGVSRNFSLLEHIRSFQQFQFAGVYKVFPANTEIEGMPNVFNVCELKKNSLGYQETSKIKKIKSPKINC